MSNHVIGQLDVTASWTLSLEIAVGESARGCCLNVSSFRVSRSSMCAADKRHEEDGAADRTVLFKLNVRFERCPS